MEVGYEQYVFVVEHKLVSIETCVGQNRKPKSSGEVSSEFDNSLEKIGVTVKSETRESNLAKNCGVVSSEGSCVWKKRKDKMEGSG